MLPPSHVYSSNKVAAKAQARYNATAFTENPIPAQFTF